MSSNEINIDLADTATLIELGTTNIKALRDNSEPPNAGPSTNTKKRKARAIVNTNL